MTKWPSRIIDWLHIGSVLSPKSCFFLLIYTCTWLQNSDPPPSCPAHFERQQPPQPSLILFYIKFLTLPASKAYIIIIFVKESAPPSQCGVALAGREVAGSSSASPRSYSCSRAPSYSGSSTTAITLILRTCWSGRYLWRNTVGLSGSCQVHLYTSWTSFNSTPAFPV